MNRTIFSIKNRESSLISGIIKESYKQPSFKTTESVNNIYEKLDSQSE